MPQGEYRDVRDLLHDGETVEDSVEFRDSRVVVTDRRLLAFTPGTPGKNYRDVDRPNVENVAVRTRSESSHLWRGLGALVVAALAVAVGLSVSVDRLFPVPQGPGAAAVGSLLDLIRAMNTAAALFDEAMLAAGGLAGVVVLAYLARYVRSRRRVVSIDLAGQRDVEIPTDDVESSSEAVERIRRALDLPVDRAGGGDGPEWRAG